MSTLRDVAKLAGCHHTTVSRALNNVSYVHPETKARIMAAVAELNYHPNIITKSIRKGKRRTIGVVVPNMHITIFDDIVQAIDAEARKNDYQIIFCHTNDNPKTEHECLDRLRSGFVDGLIIAATGRNMSLIRDIHKQGIAIVQIIRKQDETLPAIVSNYEGGSYEAVKYLYGKGCRHIGLINGPSHGRFALLPYRTRYIGYRKAIEELGLPEICEFSDGMVNSNNFESGYRCAASMLDAHPELDAIMAAVDVYGMAALRILRERNIDVPDKCRVVSLTGCSVGHFLEKSLTSFELPAKEIGTKAVQMILQRIEAPKKSKEIIENMILLPMLSERESS